jgi:hypothetical protein
MYTWLSNLVWSSRRSQHRDHGVTLGCDNCGTVNLIAQNPAEPAVLEHSKRVIKEADKMQEISCSGFMMSAKRIDVHGSLSAGA